MSKYEQLLATLPEPCEEGECYDNRCRDYYDALVLEMSDCAGMEDVEYVDILRFLIDNYKWIEESCGDIAALYREDVLGDEDEDEV